MADGADVLRPSLLDRLLTGERSGASGVHEYTSLRELRDAVARDLEWLLNTNRWLPHDLSGFEHLNDSLLTYGLPDLSVFSWRNSADAQHIAEQIEAAIRRFEPRLDPSSVVVEILPAPSVDEFRTRFRIDALLHVDPIREPVSFDTDVDLENSSIAVRGAV